MEIMVMGLGEQMEDISECLNEVSQRKNPNKKMHSKKADCHLKLQN